VSTQLLLIKSKWPATELNGKTVEFHFTAATPNGPLPVSGNGIFRAEEHQNGLMAINIDVIRPVRGAMATTTFHCHQQVADRIEKQKPGSKFAFSLFEASAP
jgi:hypothetical protein